MSDEEQARAALASIADIAETTITAVVLTSEWITVQCEDGWTLHYPFDNEYKSGPWAQYVQPNGVTLDDEDLISWAEYHPDVFGIVTTDQLVETITDRLATIGAFAYYAAADAIKTLNQPPQGE